MMEIVNRVCYWLAGAFVLYFGCKILAWFIDKFADIGILWQRDQENRKNIEKLQEQVKELEGKE